MKKHPQSWDAARAAQHRPLPRKYKPIDPIGPNPLALAMQTPWPRYDREGRKLGFDAKHDEGCGSCGKMVCACPDRIDCTKACGCKVISYKHALERWPSCFPLNDSYALSDGVGGLWVHLIDRAGLINHCDQHQAEREKVRAAWEEARYALSDGVADLCAEQIELCRKLLRGIDYGRIFERDEVVVLSCSSVFGAQVKAKLECDLIMVCPSPYTALDKPGVAIGKRPAPEPRVLMESNPPETSNKFHFPVMSAHESGAQLCAHTYGCAYKHGHEGKCFPFPVQSRCETGQAGDSYNFPIQRGLQHGDPCPDITGQAFTLNTPSPENTRPHPLNVYSDQVPVNLPDGRVANLSIDELRKGYMRALDYTQKMRELPARRALEQGKLDAAKAMLEQMKNCPGLTATVMQVLGVDKQ